MLQISECFEICHIRIPSGPSGQLPLCPRGAFGVYEFAVDFCKNSCLPRADRVVRPYEEFGKIA